MPNPVKYTDLVEADALNKIAEDARASITLLTQLSLKMKAIAKDNIKAANGSSSKNEIKDEKDLTAVYAAKTKIIKESNKVHEDNLKARLLLKKAAKDELDAIKALESPYAKLNQELVLNRQISKDLLAKQELGNKLSKEENALLVETTDRVVKLDTSIKKIDSSLGNYQRNVGAYHGSLMTYAKGLKGFAGLASMVGEAFGIETEIFEKGIDVIKESGKALKEYEHTEKAVESAKMEGKVATEAETVANELNTESTIANNISTKEAIVVKEEAIVVEEAETVAKMGVVGWILAGTVAIGAAIIAAWEYVSVSKKQKEIEEAKSTAIDGTIIKVKELREAHNEIIVSIKEEENAWKVLRGEMTENEAKLSNLKEKNRIQLQEMANETKAKTLEMSASWMSLLTGNGQADLLKQKATEYEQYMGKVKSVHDLENDFAEKNRGETQRKSIEENKKKEEEYKKESAKYLQQIQENKDKQFEIEQEEDRKTSKFQDDNIWEGNKRIREENEQILKDRIKNQYEMDKHRALQRKEQRDEDKKQSDWEDKNIYEGNERIRQENEKALDDKKKQQKQDLDTTMRFVSEMNNAKYTAQEKAINNELELHERNIMQQQSLAEAGRSNTLAFEKAEAAKAEKEKQDLAIKEEKRQKAIAFLKLLAAYADKGNPDQATMKAFTQMAIAGAIAGSYFEGTESVEDDLKGNKMHAGRDGYIIAVDGKERILNPRQNEMVGGLSNDELAQLANDYNNGLLPKNISDNGLFDQNMSNSLLLNEITELNSKIKDIYQTLKERPVNQINLNNLGDVIDTRIVNGLSKVKTQKNNSPLNYI